MRRSHGLFLVLTAALVVAGCAPPAGVTQAGAPAPAQPAAKKKLTASIFSDPAGFYQQLTNRVVGSVSGLAEL